MKLFMKIFALTIVLSACASITPPRGSAQESSVSFQLFYDQLSPYGTWVDYQNYGYVWIPDVDREFSPYGTNGHWVLTDDGWTWVSDYSWGWAPFHYGRWAYDDSYGWLWVPQNEWAPAWVSWRRSEGYYGWAPMGPGISVDIALGGGYRLPNERWTFVSDRDFSRSDLDRHYVDRSTNITIINNSTVINNSYTDNSRHTKYVAGPAREEVQRVTGTPIRPVVIRENDRPGQTLNNDQLQIYRPHVQAENGNDHKAIPTKVGNLKEVKPISERKAGDQPRNGNPPVNAKDQSPQQPNPGTPPNNGAGDQPRNGNPRDQKKSNEESAQPPTTKPSDIKGKDQQPPGSVPPVNNATGEQPRPVNPREQKKNGEQSAQPPSARPADKSGRGQDLRVINPHEKAKTIEPLALPPVPKSADIKGRGQQPRIGNPQGRNKSADQPSRQKNGSSPMNKKKLPPTPPPNVKGKDGDAEPAKKQDNKNNLSQIQLRGL